MPFVASSGTRIYWKLEGEAGNRPLVLLNSIGTDMDLWDEMLPALRRHFMLLRIDTRGHGASDAPPEDYEMGLLARDAAAAMNAAGFERAVVAGVSLGGMIAMQMAVDTPERVTGLALICTSATMDRSAWTARVDAVRTNGLAGIVDLAMSRFLSPDFADERPEVSATIRSGLLSMEAAGYAGCAAAIRDMDLFDHLTNVIVPTLIVTGRRDTSTPFEGHGEHLLDRIPHAEHVALDAAHLAPLDASSSLSAAIIDKFA